MSKSKRTRPFLEVLRQSGMSPGQVSAPKSEPWKNEPAARTKPVAPAPPKPTVRPPPPEPPPTLDAAPSNGTVAVQGDRLVLSLSSLSAAISVCILIVVMGGIYIGGVRAGTTKGRKLGYQEGVSFVRRETADEIESARNTAPNTTIFNELRSSPVQARTASTNPRRRTAGTDSPSSTRGARKRLASRSLGGEPAATPVWVKDHTYIVVQEFRSADLADAEDARRFLAERGIATVILEADGKYKYRLVANKGFDRSDANQRKWCDLYQEKIRKLGKDYVKAGGRYGLQGYQKRLTREAW